MANKAVLNFNKEAEIECEDTTDVPSARGCLASFKRFWAFSFAIKEDTRNFRLTLGPIRILPAKNISVLWKFTWFYFNQQDNSATTRQSLIPWGWVCRSGTEKNVSDEISWSCFETTYRRNEGKECVRKQHCTWVIHRFLPCKVLSLFIARLFSCELQQQFP